MPLWRGGPNTRTLPTVLLTPSASKAADMAHLCVPQNQALGVCRGFAPDIQICGTRGRKNLVNATIISNAEEEEEAVSSQDEQHSCTSQGSHALHPSIRRPPPPPLPLNLPLPQLAFKAVSIVRIMLTRLSVSLKGKQTQLL